MKILTAFVFYKGHPMPGKQIQAAPELVSGEGDDRKTEHVRVLIAVYLKISHVNKTVQLSEDYGLKGYILLRFGIKHLSKSIQFDQ